MITFATFQHNRDLQNHDSLDPYLKSGYLDILPGTENSFNFCDIFYCGGFICANTLNISTYLAYSRPQNPKILKVPTSKVYVGTLAHILPGTTMSFHFCEQWHDFMVEDSSVITFAIFQLQHTRLVSHDLWSSSIVYLTTNHRYLGYLSSVVTSKTKGFEVPYKVTHIATRVWVIHGKVQRKISSLLHSPGVRSDDAFACLWQPYITRVANPAFYISMVVSMLSRAKILNEESLVSS